MMKKLAILAAAVLLTVCVASLPVPNARPASAAIKTTAVSENFNAETLDSSLWESSGDNAALQDYGGAIQILSGEFAPAINWMGQSGNRGLETDYVLEMVISREMASGSWLAIYIGLDSFDLRFNTIGDTQGCYGNALVVNSSGLVNYTKMGVIATNTDGTSGSIKFSMKSDGSRYAVKIVAKIGATMADNALDFYIAPEGEDYGAKKGTLTGLSLKGYFGFGSMSTGIATVSKIKISERGADDQPGALIWEPKDDLKTPNIDHIYGSASADETKEFRMWNSYAGEYADRYTNGPLSSVRITNGGTLTCKADIQPDQSLLTLYGVEFSMRTEALGNTGAALVVGKTENGGTEIVFRNRTVEDDVMTCLTIGDNEYSLGKNVVGSSIKYQFVVKSNQTAVVYMDGKEVLTVGGIQSLSGKVGFASKDAETTFEIDDFTVTKFVASDSQSANVSIDFTRKVNDKVFVNTEEDWYLAGSVYTLNGEIAFINAGPGSFFGTKQKFSDYVVRFDLFDMTQGATDGNPGCNWIAVNLAKTEYTGTYNDSPTILFSPRDIVGDKVNTMNLEAEGGVLFTTGSATIKSGYNFFEELTEGRAANIMIVVRNRTATLYFKYSDEPESMLTVPRAVIQDIDTLGYISVSCNYGGNFSLANFSVRNLSANSGFITDTTIANPSKGDASLLGE